MAKSARASAIKKNKQGLKSRVFGPAEQARNERLAKKLELLAAQPKPLRAEMEVEQSNGSQDAEHSERKAQGALSPSLSIPIPASLFPVDEDEQLPTPPESPAPIHHASDVFFPLDLPTQKSVAKEQLFWNLLGAATDILGFDNDGALRLGFDFGSPRVEDDDTNDADMDVDGVATKPKPRSINAQKKAKAAKAASIDKKRRRKPRNTMVFPTYHSKRGKKASTR